MLKHYFKLTIKLLKRKKVFTFVTMAGIVGPVLLIVLIASFLTHINDYNPPRTNFKNVIYLDAITWKEIKDNGDVNMIISNPPSFGFIQQYVKTMKTPLKVAVVSNSVYSDPAVVYLHNKPYELNIKYTDDTFWQITDFKFLDGRAFNKTEYNNGNRVIVIDEKTSLAFFGTLNSVGMNMEIGNTSYKIIGVVKNVDKMYYRITANVYMPFTCSEVYQSKSILSDFSTALLLMENKKSFAKAEREFQEKLKQVDFRDAQPISINHIEGSLNIDTYLNRIKNLVKDLFKIYNFHQGIYFLAVLILIFIFIVLPSINLVNINMNRVYERLSETGVRRSYGARVIKLIQQFLFENLIITILGGFISLILALIAIFCINYFDLLSGIYLGLNFKALLVSLLAVFLIGLLSGLAPSVIMARKKIILSLDTSA